MGELIWDDEFSLAPAEAQQFLLQVCNDLEEGDLASDGTVVCWIETFKADMEALGKQFPIQDEQEFLDSLNKWFDDGNG